MLSDRNIRKINEQIAEELQKMWSQDHEQKMQTLTRVAALREIITDPKSDVTVEEVVDHLVESGLPSELNIDLGKIFAAFRQKQPQE